MKPHATQGQLLLLVTIGVSLTSGCMTVPETGRRQLNLIPRQAEMELGISSFNQMKSQSRLSADAGLQAMVQRVGRRIAAVAPLQGAQWEFVVVENNEANAFCMPGGKVAVYTGILPITKDEAGLAAVMGHEVAHAVARHGAARISEAMMFQLGAQMLNQALASSDPRTRAAWTQAYGLGTTLGWELPHNRTQESEADKLGLLYMARAGYDPEEAVKFWQRFAAYNKSRGGGQLWFLRTHPVDEKRIADLQKAMPEAKAQFRPK
ncbi:MAG: M48 family metallopeptidase [Verrucomicrobia bacterium]|nr:M48 family metallopeptidase [Verrucomicrobiota bacterium]